MKHRKYGASGYLNEGFLFSSFPLYKKGKNPVNTGVSGTLMMGYLVRACYACYIFCNNRKPSKYGACRGLNEVLLHFLRIYTWHPKFNKPSLMQKTRFFFVSEIEKRAASAKIMQQCNKTSLRGPQALCLLGFLLLQKT
jgi:hypothetical protein